MIKGLLIVAITYDNRVHALPWFFIMQKKALSNQSIMLVQYIQLKNKMSCSVMSLYVYI